MQTSVFVAPNSLAIECVITPSGGFTKTLNPFSNQQQLVNKKVIAIETYYNIDIANSPVTSGNPIIGQDLFVGAYLSLYTSTMKDQRPGLFYDLIPFPSLRRVQNNDTAATPLGSFSTDLFRIRPTELSWEKCSVVFPTAIAAGRVFSAVFNVYYLDEGDAGTNYM